MKIFFKNESDADNRPSSVPSKFLTQTGFCVKYFFSWFCDFVDDTTLEKFKILFGLPLPKAKFLEGVEVTTNRLLKKRGI